MVAFGLGVRDHLVNLSGFKRGLISNIAHTNLKMPFHDKYLLIFISFLPISMSFVPVNLCVQHGSVRKAYFGKPLHFPPIRLPVIFIQPGEISNAVSRGDDFNVFDRSDNLKIHADTPRIFQQTVLSALVKTILQTQSWSNAQALPRAVARRSAYSARNFNPSVRPSKLRRGQAFGESFLAEDGGEHGKNVFGRGADLDGMGGGGDVAAVLSGLAPAGHIPD